MKNFKKIISISFLSTLVIMSSCKKDEVKPSKAQMLTAKTWIITKYEIAYDNKTVDATDEFLYDCDKDDLIKFMPNGTYQNLLGVIKCHVNEEDEFGTWAFKNNETIIHIKYTSDSEDMDLISVDADILKLGYRTYYDINNDGIDENDVKVIITAKAK